jgi:hypothetical protein
MGSNTSPSLGLALERRSGARLEGLAEKLINPSRSLHCQRNAGADVRLQYLLSLHIGGGVQSRFADPGRVSPMRR